MRNRTELKLGALPLWSVSGCAVLHRPIVRPCARNRITGASGIEACQVVSSSVVAPPPGIRGADCGEERHVQKRFRIGPCRGQALLQQLRPQYYASASGRICREWIYMMHNNRSKGNSSSAASLSASCSLLCSHVGPLEVGTAHSPVSERGPVADQRNSIHGRVAVVTGSSSGNGRAIALALASEGAYLVCSDLTPEVRAGGYEKTLVPTHELISQQKGKAVFQKADTSSEEDVKALIAYAVQTYGRVDM